MRRLLALLWAELTTTHAWAPEDFRAPLTIGETR